MRSGRRKLVPRGRLSRQPSRTPVCRGIGRWRGSPRRAARRGGDKGAPECDFTVHGGVHAGIVACFERWSSSRSAPAMDRMYGLVAEPARRTTRPTTRTHSQDRGRGPNQEAGIREPLPDDDGDISSHRADDYRSRSRPVLGRRGRCTLAGRWPSLQQPHPTGGRPCVGRVEGRRRWVARRLSSSSRSRGPSRC